MKPRASLSSWLLILALFQTTLAASFASQSFADTDPKTNIILFLIDDLGWMDLGCQGSTYYQTPNIDRLAREGVRFTDAYAACAVCSPTRAALLTGKYPARLLLTDWLPSGRWNPTAKLREGRFIRGLPVEELTLAEAFREAEYATANIGKWHLGSEPFSMPEHHGFEINIGGNAHGAPGRYFFPYDGDWLIPATGQRAKWTIFAEGKSGEYLTDRLTDEAVRYIGEHKKVPFFLYFPHYGVHAPLQGKPGLVARYEAIPESRRQGKPEYAAMVESVDQSVGRVLEVLEQHGIADHTLIIFTSDNGGLASATRHEPLRGNKGAYYEGGIRVPLIIKWPGKAAPGQICTVPVTSSDLYPTCLEAAGLSKRPHQHLDGQSLVPLMTGGKGLNRESLFWHYPHYNSHPASVPSSVIRKGTWKLIQTYDPAGLELYNLENDLGETSNLADHEPQKLTELKNDLEAWKTSVDAEEMRPNPDYSPSLKKAKGTQQSMPKRP